MKISHRANEWERKRANGKEAICVCVGEFACSYAKTVAVNILQQHISQNYNRTSFTKW